MKKKSLAKNMALLPLLAILACAGTGDSDDDSDSPTPDPWSMDENLIGDWRSEGDDVAPLLADFGVVRIDVTFNDDQTYLVASTDVAGTETTFSGVFATMPSSVEGIMSIVLDQSAPTVLTSKGIYQIDTSATPHRMTYEVVQTDPSIGATPPTAEQGFGSSSNGAFGDDNIQRYNRL